MRTPGQCVGGYSDIVPLWVLCSAFYGTEIFRVGLSFSRTSLSNKETKEFLIERTDFLLSYDNILVSGFCKMHTWVTSSDLPCHKSGKNLVIYLYSIDLRESELTESFGFLSFCLAEISFHAFQSSLRGKMLLFMLHDENFFFHLSSSSNRQVISTLSWNISIFALVLLYFPWILKMCFTSGEVLDSMWVRYKSKVQITSLVEGDALETSDSSLNS